MESARTLIETALTDFVVRESGVRPAWKPSKRAHCATSAFLRADAKEIAARLNENRAACTLFGVPLLKEVREENGWILVCFTAEALDTLAARLPKAEEPDEGYFVRRLWTWAQHADCPTPDDAALLQGVYGVLFGAPDAEQTLLSAPTQLDGTARIALEQRLSRAAKVLLWERRMQT